MVNAWIRVRHPDYDQLREMVDVEETAVLDMAYTEKGIFGRTIAASLADGSIHFWVVSEQGIKDQNFVPMAEDRNFSGQRAIAFTPDGRWIVVGNPNGDIVRWPTNLQVVPDKSNIKDSPRAAINELVINISDDGTYITASAHEDGFYISRNGLNLFLQGDDGNISAAARALNMHRRTLQRKLDKRPVRE